MLDAVAPRPIAFASTLDADGNPNLAPFSFFNAFSSNPPTLVFSANRKVRDNTTKDTYKNIKATGEVVINVVSYNFVRKAALASVEFPHGISEFEKVGLTQLSSEIVKPFRVAESPVHFECRVKDIIELGEKGGAGNLFICEILLMHIREDILNDQGNIDFNKIDLCARMGAARYCRASGNAVFEIVQPVNKIGIGFDQLPENVKRSKILTGNELAELASMEQLPDEIEVQQFSGDDFLKELKSKFTGESLEEQLHHYAKKLLKEGKKEIAWRALLQK